jgi:hypothetical protein
MASMVQMRMKLRVISKLKELQLIYNINPRMSMKKMVNISPARRAKRETMKSPPASSWR